MYIRVCIYSSDPHVIKYSLIFLSVWEWRDSSAGDGSGEIAQLVTVLYWCRRGTNTNLLTAITFSCTAIYFLAVYNLQRHHRSVPLILCLDGVEG